MQPGYVTEGFVFLPRVEGGRYVDIRLAGDAYEANSVLNGKREDDSLPAPGSFSELRFGFALTLPDGEFDYERLDTSRTYGETELSNLDTDSLRRALERLPCCATNADGDRNGDPLNVVIVGDAGDVMHSLSRCGWSFTHRITLATVRRLVAAAIEGKGYAVAPVSNLYAFGRKQDIALQRARRSISQRNHMRLWLAPFQHQGRQVWVGQVSRDIGIKITTKSPSLTTHIIDPEVDLTREYLLHSLLAQGHVERFGFVKGGARASAAYPTFNLAEDPYFSDGMRLVVMLSPHPVPYDRVRSLLWERSGAPIVEGQTEAALRNVRRIDRERLEAN
jgi:hypothetical protein